MKRLFQISGFVLVLFTMTSCILPDDRVTIWMIGDSTMCYYEPARAPLTGWGTPFAGFFDSSVQVENKARGGRSTRTFISENRWREIEPKIKKGDYVFIQFGHNDEAKEEKYKERYTSIPDYKINLTKFINETKSRDAIPVLISPVSRMRFKDGFAEETHKEYSEAVWEIGRVHNVPVIDLDKTSRQLYQSLGPVYTKYLFMQLDTLAHPNYPAGQKDNTHFNEYGARMIAQLVLQEMKFVVPDLYSRVIKPVVNR